MDISWIYRMAYLDIWKKTRPDCDLQRFLMVWFGSIPLRGFVSDWGMVPLSNLRVSGTMGDPSQSSNFEVPYGTF